MDDEIQLIEQLKALCALGPIPAIGMGSNSVGKTMQKHLGITHSVRGRNVLHGHTITSTLAKPNSGGRTNLFACVPDWSSSVFKSSKELVSHFGKEDLVRGYHKSLFCTVNSKSENSFGLFLKADSVSRTLEEWSQSAGYDTLAVKWRIDKLEAKLMTLGRTAILRALPVNLGGKRGFHFRYLDLLGAPDFVSFLELLENGSITVDHLISIKQGSNSAKEQGPLFKIRADAREDLYKGMRRYDLMDC